MNQINLLITGAGGFLGSNIAKKLSSNPKYKIFSFSRSTYPELEALNITQRVGDLKNYLDVERALEGIDEIIHTASLVGMWGDYSDFYDTNVIGTKNILDAMEKHQIKKLVYTSTPSVAFGDKELCGVDESIPYPKKYISNYAKTKSIAEQLVLKKNSPYLATVALRPHLIFGPGDKNLIPRVVMAHKQSRLKIIGDGENLVDVTFIDNAVEAHIMALEKLDINSTIAGKAYFIGQGPVKLWDFTNSILTKAGMGPIKNRIPLRLAYFIGQVTEIIFKILRINHAQPAMTRFIALQLGLSHYFNHQKMEHELGYVPSVSIEEGIKKLIENESYFKN